MNFKASVLLGFMCSYQVMAAEPFQTLLLKYSQPTTEVLFLVGM